MKLITLLSLFTSLAFAVPGEIFVSECSRYPQIDAKAIRYQNNGPSMYGVWFYDLVYRNDRTVILLDAFERPACDKPLVKSVVLRKRFELAENFGKPAQLEKDVRAYVKSHEIEKCPE